MITIIITKMRTIIDIPDNYIQILNGLSKKQKVSRASIIRQALANHIDNYFKNEKNYQAAFGILKNEKIDSLSYQKERRNEWE